MIRTMRSVLLAGFLTLLPLVCTAQDTDNSFDRYYDESWTYTTRTDNEQSLADKGSPCVVAAAGWKLMDEEYRQDQDDWWFESGDRWVQWSWRLVVGNTSRYSVDVTVDASLYSNDQFVLDEEYFYERDLIDGHDWELVQYTRWYNATAKENMGSPSYFDWSIECR